MTAFDLASYEPERILVCQQRQIGDVLLATPIFRLLKHRYAQAEIHVFTEEKCVPLLLENPFIDTIHTIIKQQGIVKQIAFYRSIARCRFDLVINFQQLPRCRTMTFFSRAHVRLSFGGGLINRLLYTHTPLPAQGYACCTKASLLAPLGITYNGERPEIYLTHAERSQAALMLTRAGMRNGAKLISIDSTHRRSSKRWPADRWARLIALLSEAHHGTMQFVLLCGPGEKREILQLRDLCIKRGVKENYLLMPDFSSNIRLSAAAMALASLHIGGCSAPRHIAVALGVPSLIIPGASGTEWRCPMPMHQELRPQLTCQPCSKIACNDPQCLSRVTPEEVFAATMNMLA